MNQIFALVLMVLVAAFSRLIPHPWNFTAIGAMALFGGAYFPSKKQSLFIPIAALILSDLVLGFHETMLFVYGAFLATVLIGWTLREERSVLKVGTLSLVTSAVFFLVSNFGVWLMQSMYAKTWAGLVECYVAAIPFFGNQVAGDLFFAAVLFGAYETLKKVSPSFAKQSV
ncbi:hypothetical protein AZI86_18640 [Bdellovibrio bacteriovorus]|uniref:Uncharacterized protein n=1 Tax=Bdellovibrio bacteriovorus TaxID=959 RepID=A0A150WF88_BDEBC|nr:DUF6580 family putative transport protein [Bdellovibrio bacteriovorus]KYG61709.1 hypothetical protein AZI86_18640 [Bdellovibrio bacteriovorus]